VPNPSTFNYGFAFEYSLPYLECCVKDIGLREPFNRLIPLVEVAFCRCLPIPIVAPYDGVTRTPLRISLSSSNPSRAACRAK